MCLRVLCLLFPGRQLTPRLGVCALRVRLCFLLCGGGRGVLGCGVCLLCLCLLCRWRCLGWLLCGGCLFCLLFCWLWSWLSWLSGMSW